MQFTFRSERPAARESGCAGQVGARMARGLQSLPVEEDKWILHVRTGRTAAPAARAIRSSLTVAVAARIVGAAEQRRHPMKRFMFGLLASGLLTLGLAGAPAKVEAAPPQTAIYQAAAQTVQPVKSQYLYRGWRRGWYGPQWGGYGYAPSRAYYYGGYYPYGATYYSTPYYYS